MNILTGNFRTTRTSLVRTSGFACLILLASLIAARISLASDFPPGLLKLVGGAAQIDPANPVGPAVPPTEPVITRIVAAGNEIVITAWVPAGKQRVTLECRPRIGPGSWVPESRQILNGRAGEVEFHLSNRRELELLRIRAESRDELPLPAAFYSGRSQFSGVVVTNSTPARSVDTGLSPGGISGLPATPLVTADINGIANGSAALTVRTVAESDIWRLEGNTLYFFNQGRGLQVIDVTDRDHPQLRGSLPVAAYGEQMYLLPAEGATGEHFVALLLASGCSEGGSVLVARISADGTPSVVNQLPFAGQLRESRLVGNALYLASYWWHASTVSEVNAAGNLNLQFGPWQSDTVVTSYNLAEPAAPNLSPFTLSLSANPAAISATDQFLFVATTANPTYDSAIGTVIPGTNSVEIVDISDPAGRMVRRGTAVTRGVVQDKFKLSQQGDVLRVASFRSSFGRAWPTTNWISKESGALVTVTGGLPGSASARRLPPARPDLYRAEVFNQFDWPPAQTWLETFSLTDASAPAKLGELLLKENEQLYATRFAGDRAYIVTFRRIDPLFIVDLKDPTQPAIRGLLEVPGFSTYLSPLSDARLLAMGLENGQPIVSLFDVSDITQPRLISKVDLKAQNGWGYSEANNDEKAFNYSPEAGLILFPWQGWQDGRSFQTIQLVDLHNDVLTRRGAIDHAVTARRATVLGDRVLSVSAAELLTVSIADRDHPTVTSTVPLQYRVDRLWVLDDRLVQLAYETASDGTANQPWIRLAPQSAPELPTGLISLPAGMSTLGLDLRASHLHVLQQAPTTYRTEAQIVTNTVQEWVRHKEARRETNFSLTILPPEFLVTFITNWQTVTMPQPPLKTVLSTNEWVVEIPYPLFPSLVPYWTNISCLPDSTVPCVTNVLSNVVWVELPPLVRTNRTYVYGPETPQPDLVVTNEIVIRQVEEKPGQIITNAITVVTNWYTLPPVLETNQYVMTNQLSIPVPGHLLSSVIDCSGAAPRLVGQTRSESLVTFTSSGLAALWPADNLLVWTDATATGSSSWGPYLDYGPQLGGLVPGGAVRPVAFWGDWPWWGGSTEAHFLPVEVSNPGQPVVRPPLTLGNSQSWSRVHPAFAVDGRIFLSHETRTELPAQTVTNGPGTKPGPTGDIIIGGPVFSLPFWSQIWETHYHLDVIDLTDPVEARVRAPLPLPAPLAGISHGGALIYTKGGANAAGTWVDQLQALSYDGLEVNLVDTLPAVSTSLVLRTGGVAIVGIAGTTNAPATLESWSIGMDARWHRYAQIPLPEGAALGLHAYPDGLVIAQGDAGRFSFLKSTGPDSLIPLGNSIGQCGLSPDWPTGNASLTAGLWLARGPYGVWVVRPAAVPLNP